MEFHCIRASGVVQSSTPQSSALGIAVEVRGARETPRLFRVCPAWSCGASSRPGFVQVPSNSVSRIRDAPTGAISRSRHLVPPELSPRGIDASSHPAHLAANDPSSEPATCCEGSRGTNGPLFPGSDCNALAKFAPREPKQASQSGIAFARKQGWASSSAEEAGRQEVHEVTVHTWGAGGRGLLRAAPQVAPPAAQTSA